MKFLPIFLVFFIISDSFSQSYNINLKTQLDSIMVLDQKYRTLMQLQQSKEKADSLARSFEIPVDQLNSYLWQKQNAIDSSNLIRIEKIIKEKGYPGKTMVGTPTNQASYYVLQHSPKIKDYLPTIKKAADEKELEFPLYAMMYDRFLMQEGKEQIYGTQAYGLPKFAIDGKQDGFEMFIWPIKNPNEVNRIRKEAGFGTTVEENAKRMGVEYKPLTLQEVEAMKKNKIIK